MEKTISQKTFLKLLSADILRLGGSRKALEHYSSDEWGDDWTCSKAYLSNVKNGKRVPTAELCMRLGLEREKTIMYRYTKIDGA